MPPRSGETEYAVILHDKNPVVMADRSKVIKAEGHDWKSVDRKQYKDDPGTYEGVHRYTLLGDEDGEEALNSQTRYFEVSPGGYTSLERHRHPHSVIVIRGSGTVVLGNRLRELDMRDVVYVAPGTLHQFHADRGDPLGFICVVDRERDRPQLPDRETIDRIITDPEVRKRIRR